jgi:hypothetical protein
LPPDLAVEMLSLHERARDRYDKLAEFFDLGVRQVGGRVGPKPQTVTVYRAYRDLLRALVDVGAARAASPTQEDDALWLHKTHKRWLGKPQIARGKQQTAGGKLQDANGLTDQTLANAEARRFHLRNQRASAS